MASFIPETNIKRIVIIVGGFGGIELAHRLDTMKFQVVLLDKNNFHTFQPLLYQVATGGLEPDSVAYPIRKIFANKKNFVFRVVEALKIKSEENILVTNNGELKYDYLILATGSTTNFFGNTAIEKNAMRLKGVTDALDLRSLLLQNFEEVLTMPNDPQREKFFNIVIVGGGPTGVEIAGALAELKKHVLPNDYPELNFMDLKIHLVEASGKLLSGMSEKSSVKAKEFLEKMGVLIWNSSVVSYADEKAILKDGTVILSSTLIWTAGVKGKIIDGLDENTLTRSSRFKVDAYNKIISYDNIFAIGDLAAVSHNGKESHPMVAPVAIQQAKNLASNLNKNDSRSWKGFIYKDLGSMATIGRNKAVAELGHLKFQGILAWFIWMFVHLMSIVGFRNRIIVLINWMWNYFSYDRAIRLIIRPFKKSE